MGVEPPEQPMSTSPRKTPRRIEDAEMEIARAALRRGLVEPDVLRNTLARVRNLREGGVHLPLDEAMEEDAVPTRELGRIRKALRPTRRRPQIKGYRILGVAGRGALGVVYKARQVSMNRIVALKVLPKVLVENRRDVDRFLREARLAANLNHPHVVRVFEVGRLKDRYFISMEFVPGATLAERVARRGVLPTGRSLAMARDVARGLQHAHARGVIHRDLKPGNVMLRDDGPVKIVDLGLARGISTIPAERITEIGVLLGTPEFMAPEQARDPTAVDARADLYSLGATLYFALAGRPPVEGRTSLEVLARLFGRESVPLETQRPDLPEPVHAWVRRATAYRPGDRFPDAGSAGAALEEILETLPEVGRSWHEKFDDTRLSDRRPARDQAARGRLRLWLPLALCAASGVAAGASLLVLLPECGKPTPPDAAAPPAEAPVLESSKALAVERDARAQALLAEAEAYLEAHPEGRQEAARRLREVIDRYPGTLAAFKAKDRLEALEGGE